MGKTTNYQLNKPEVSDPLRVADFNENADRIEAALGALNTVVANAGNCRIATGSYVGTGTYGTSAPLTITLDFEPKAVWIFCGSYDSGAFFKGGVAQNASTSNSIRCFLKGGSSLLACVYSGGGYSNTNLYYTMENNAFSCYNTLDAAVQMNTEGTTYHYLAIG